MALLTGAVTYLALIGAPGLPPGDFTGKTLASGGRPDDGQFTRLFVSANPGSVTADYTKSAATSSRPNDGTFNRVTPTATAGQPWGDFSGKTLTTDIEKSASFSVIPVVTYGRVANVDVDTPLSIVPRVALSATVQRAISANFTVRPVLTQSRGAVSSTGVTPKATSLSVVPRVALSASVAYSISASLSVVPVVSLSAAIEDAGKNAAFSIIPVVRMNTAVNRVNATQAWNVPMVARPTVRMSTSIDVFGEVDRITVNASPKGRIRVTKV